MKGAAVRRSEELRQQRIEREEAVAQQYQRQHEERERAIHQRQEEAKEKQMDRSAFLSRQVKVGEFGKLCRVVEMDTKAHRVDAQRE